MFEIYYMANAAVLLLGNINSMDLYKIGWKSNIQIHKTDILYIINRDE